MDNNTRNITRKIDLNQGSGRGVLDRRDVLDLMHGRYRMTIDPRNPTMPGRSMSGFHRPGEEGEGGGHSFRRLLLPPTQLIYGYIETSHDKYK